MTQEYKAEYTALLDNLHRLEADYKYYQHLTLAPDPLTRSEGRNGLKAVSTQIPRQQQFINSAIAKYERALSDGEITKFW